MAEIASNSQVSELKKPMEGRSESLNGGVEEVGSNENQFCSQLLPRKEEQEPELDLDARRIERLIQEKENDYAILLQESIKESSAELDLKEKELALVRKSLEECRLKRHVEEQRLHSIEREIEARSKELEIKEKLVSSTQGQLSLCCRDIETKEREDDAIRRSIEEHNREFEAKGEQLKSIQKQISECERLLRLKEEECNWQLEMVQKIISERDEVYKKMQMEIEECDKELEEKEARLSFIEDLIREREEELKTKDMEFYQVLDNIDKDREKKEEELRALLKKIAECTKELKKKEELDGMRGLINGQAKEVEVKRKNLLKSMLEKINQLVQELRSNKKEFDSFKQLMKERSLELEKKEKQLEDGVKDLGTMKKQFERRVKVHDLKEKQYEERVKELESNEKQYEERVQELESNEKQYEVQAKELESKEKQFEGQVKDLESKQNLYNGQVKELELKDMQFKGQVKEFESKVKQFEGQAKDLESKQNQFEGQLKELELKEKQYESLRKAFEEETMLKEKCWKNIDILPDNQLSLTTDGRNLELLSGEQTNEPELIGNDILVNLQKSSDPAKLVLDIIQDPIVPERNEGDKGVIIDGSHILLLEQLMRISPHIKPHVREEALKLALDLKANMRANTENSLVVLGFLMLLSIYGLVSSFEENEVLQLFEFTGQHKQAVELFQTLGFVDKISDFVQNLTKKKQHIEAVKFVCAYKLADKIQPVDLLREYVEKSKVISKRFCRKTKFTVKKVKGRDMEIASLGAVLKCISDNNLEAQDLVKEIQDRILGLERQKEYIIRSASEPSSNVEVQKPEEKKATNEAATKNQVKVQQPEEKKRTNEAVTNNQFQQGGNEAVTNHRHFQQRGNNSKRPRTAATYPLPSGFSPKYQHVSMPCHERGIPRPGGMPAQFGFPSNYFGHANPIDVGRFGNRGTNYFRHSGHYPRF